MDGHEREDVVKSRGELISEEAEALERHTHTCRHHLAVVKELPLLHWMLRQGRRWREGVDGEAAKEEEGSHG